MSNSGGVSPSLLTLLPTADFFYDSAGGLPPSTSRGDRVLGTPRASDRCCSLCLGGEKRSRASPSPLSLCDPPSLPSPGNFEVSTNSPYFGEYTKSHFKSVQQLVAASPTWRDLPACFLWPELLPPSKTEQEPGSCSVGRIFSSYLLKNRTTKIKLN